MRVHACGINPVEAYIRTGSYARQPELPYTPGSDAAGEVAAIGNGVTNLKVSLMVYGYGRLPVCLSHCLFVCLFVCLFAYHIYV